MPTAPVLKLFFYKFLDYESKPEKAGTIKSSKKLLNLIIYKCKKSYATGLSHYYATTIWNSVPALMATPVYVNVNQENIIRSTWK